LYRKQRLGFEETQAPEFVHCLEAKPFEVIMNLVISVSLLLLLVSWTKPNHIRILLCLVLYKCT